MVADDFAAIAKRLKEIEAEVAKERAETESRRKVGNQSQPDLQYTYGDMGVCV